MMLINGLDLYDPFNNIHYSGKIKHMESDVKGNTQILQLS